MTKTAELAGVTCGVCGQEAFQVAVREAALSGTTRVNVQCCPRCTRRVDMENEWSQTKELLRGMSKAERRQELSAESFRWADWWNGKHVLVTFHASDGHGGWVEEDCEVKGMAHRGINACGGWGAVRVTLDESEYHRITGEHEAWLGNKKILVPTFDGHQYGLDLMRFGSICCFDITWGYRNAMLLEEIP